MSFHIAAVTLLILVATLSSGCTSDGTGNTKPSPTDAARSSPALSAAADLAGTSWQLVNIKSMDDKVYTPDDAALYTLAFGSDGSMRVQADCNRGTGSWSSDAAGQLRFGKIAATMALCPPGSLHDRYLDQFKWVRSYVIENGHLYLATMADGSIIEFQPAGAVPQDKEDSASTRLRDDALVPGTGFHATGDIPCTMGGGQPTGACPFGVKREGNGSGIVTVTKPDGRTRSIFFDNGRATGYDVNEADPGKFSADKQADLNIIRIGQERYEIPDAVIWGG